MPRSAIAPTKSNLIKTKTGLAFAREGHELLTKKRDILVTELLSLMAAATDAQRLLDEQLAGAYAALDEATLALGSRGVREASWAVGLAVETNITERRVMGVSLPTVHSTARGTPPFYALPSTSFWLDEAQRRFSEVIKRLDDLAGMRISVIRLAREVKKSIRRVNALEKIYIPDYEDVLKYIVDSLEESDREAFFILKLIKARIERADATPGGDR